MTNGKDVTDPEQDAATSHRDEYDPFVRGRFPVGVRTIQALDTERNRLFPCEIWYPAAAASASQDVSAATQDVFTVLDTPRTQQAIRDAAAHPGTYPLIIFSHASGHHRRGATFLCTHLSSHGYVVAALDHSEVVAAALGPPDGETEAQKTARVEAVIANRVPDVRFLLDHLLSTKAWDSDAALDLTHVGIVGHSFGGWTALAAPDVERRIRAVVALAPAGSSHRKPGILPVTLEFGWGRDVPTLYLVAENDVSLPLAGMYELFERTPATKQLVILCRADHAHFMDDVEEIHENTRRMPFTGELAWLPKEMRPITELCSGEQAHVFVRGLTLCHMDSVLRRQEDAQRFLAGDVETELAQRGVNAIVEKLDAGNPIASA
jgi:predicted dienelactone hydrolase